MRNKVITGRICQLDCAVLRYFSWELRDFLVCSEVHLEIGFGNGEFLINMAQHYPGRSFIGIEQSGKYFHKALRKVQNLRLGNVKLVMGDAKSCLPLLFPPELIDCVHINFPDPWFKNYHRRRRLIDGAFVTEIARILKPKGTVDIASDYAEYFENIVCRFETNGFLKIYNDSLPPPLRLFKTKYEKEFAHAGAKIFYSVLNKS